jgi:APA family basic amino acid/polyamine antiporter
MLFRRLFARKSLELLIAEMAGEQRLRRALGPVSLTALGVGCIIGAGIFVMTGRAAASDAGPAIMVSYSVAALGCALAALCYAEFAAMAPVAGSAYTYAYATLGELCAWIIGWDLILEYAMACACVAAGWAEYLNEFLRILFGVTIPDFLCADPFSHPGAWFNLPAVSILVVITTILIVGIRESAWTNALLTVVKLCVVLFVIGLGLTLIHPGRNNWTEVPYSERLTSEQLILPDVVAEYTAAHVDEASPADPERERRLLALASAALRSSRAADSPDSTSQASGESPSKDDQYAIGEILQMARDRAKKMELEKWGMIGHFIDPQSLAPLDDRVRSNFSPYGISGIMLGAAIVFFAFIGFDSISTHSEEAIRPQRDVPIAILVSLAICTILYVLVAAVITGMEPYHSIDTKAAVAAAFRKRAELEQSPMLRLSSGLIATGALAGLTSVLLVTFLSQARVFLAMARDRLLPDAIFGAVHPRFKTPHLSTGLTGLVICLVAAFTPITDLEKMVNIGTLFAFVVVCSTVLVLRIQRPNAERPFRCPLVYVVAPAGILVNTTMMLFLPAATWLRLVGWLVIGLLIYFLYGYRNSTLGRELVETLAKEGIGPSDAPLKT